MPGWIVFDSVSNSLITLNLDVKAFNHFYETDAINTSFPADQRNFIILLW